jgi:uncharacterized protein with HEPN domain
MRDAYALLHNIQEAIANIMKYTSQGRQAFEQDELIQIWVIRHLTIIGNISRDMPQDFKNQHPEIAWKELIDMSDVLIHSYFEVDMNRVWDTVEHDLPRLKARVDALLNSDGGENEGMEQGKQE